MSARTIHPFPARMAPEIAINVLRSSPGDRALVVLDPMCGSGTSLSVAARHGHRAIGFDLDPLAVLMSQVAVTPIRDVERVPAAATKVVSAAMRSRSTSPLWDDRETLAFAEYWFGPQQRQALTRLARALRRVEPTPVRRALQIALSRIIVTKSPAASLAADTSHSRPHRVLADSRYDVYEGFLRSAARLSVLLPTGAFRGSGGAHLGDSRDLGAHVLDSTVDFVVTSPPYLNAIDYMRGHRLALIWLGFTLPELRAIRRNSVGAERAPDCAIPRHARAMVDRVRESAANPDGLPETQIARYAADLCAFATEIFRVLRPGGVATVVVGNSTIRGNFIANDAIAQSALAEAGLEAVGRSERELPASRRYLPITAHEASVVTNRMRSEVILTMQKPQRPR